MADIFVSYSSADQRQADAILDLLKAQGLSVFLAAYTLRPGTPWPEEIRRELRKCKGFLPLLSKSSLKSEWVIKEIAVAWGLRKHLFPILIDLKHEALPYELRYINAKPLGQLDNVIQEVNAWIKKIRPDSLASKPRTLIFDVDGTLLGERESFAGPAGTEWRPLLERLSKRGFRFVFITGNDYKKQHRRVLQPLIDWGVARSAFCFTDGGSRAFEFLAGSRTFDEIKQYSNGNRINEKDQNIILQEFRRAFKAFLATHDSLRVPTILPYDRKHNYLEYIIRPIRPSFFKGPALKAFCKDVYKCWEKLGIRTTTINLSSKVANALVIKAHGRSPNVDDHMAKLVNVIFRELFSKKEYRRIALPEVEVRGGKTMTCQIALKPFADDDLRKKFHKIMVERLSARGLKYDVFRGGQTTIDIQRRGVNKSKAIKFAMKRFGVDPSTAFYFGDEFVPFGNDLPVAFMRDDIRPSRLIHVGETAETPNEIDENLIIDGNGPRGTLNHLKMIDSEILL